MLSNDMYPEPSWVQIWIISYIIFESLFTIEIQVGHLFVMAYYV
jgi:hypothetical protein